MRATKRRCEPRARTPSCGGQADGVIASACGAAKAYLATELATAPPRRLGMLLYDSAISLCRGAIDALDVGDTELAGDRLARAMQIMHQLGRDLLDFASPMQPAVGVTSTMPTPTSSTGPAESCWEFLDLYDRAQRRLIEADFYRRREPVAEAVTMLTHQRGRWAALAGALGRHRVSKAADLAETCWIG